MLTIDPKSTPTSELYQYLIGAIAPRPIAFASTVDLNGIPNLAPYSFFNVFSANPPIVIFSSTRRINNNTTKDTLANILATKEVVINVVNYSIVRQMAVASMNFPPEVSEFKKSGLTPIPSDLVKPPRVKESPVQMECRVREVLPLGEEGGAGNLIISEIVCLHIDEEILDERGRINPHKIDLMGRMGRAYYVRASSEAIYTILNPYEGIGIGYEALPPSARQSETLTANNLGQLAAIPYPPTAQQIQALRLDKSISALTKSKQGRKELHEFAQRELAKENIELAAQLVWLAEEVGREMVSRS